MSLCFSMALSSTWEADALLRNRARQNERVTVWPDPKSMGVSSMKACSQNARVLQLISHWWVERSDKASSIPIDEIRAEAGLIIKPGKNKKFIAVRNIRSNIVGNQPIQFWFKTYRASSLEKWYGFHWKPSRPSKAYQERIKKPFIPCQVVQFREVMALASDPAAVHLDAWGLKRLFSHCLRRWLAGSNRPRESWNQIV